MALVQRTAYRVECDGTPHSEYETLLDAEAALPGLVSVAYTIDYFAIYPIYRYTEEV